MLILILILERQSIWLSAVLPTLFVDAVVLGALKVMLVHTFVYFFVFKNSIVDARMSTIMAISDFVKMKQMALSSSLSSTLSSLVLSSNKSNSHINGSTINTTSNMIRYNNDNTSDGYNDDVEITNNNVHDTVNSIVNGNKNLVTSNNNNSVDNNIPDSIFEFIGSCNIAPTVDGNSLISKSEGNSLSLISSNDIISQSSTITNNNNDISSILHDMDIDINIIQENINAADYFFVSKLIAKSFPHLLESQFVLNFSIPFPTKMKYHRDDYKPDLNYHNGRNKIKSNTNTSCIGKIFEQMFNIIYNTPAKRIKNVMRLLSFMIIAIVVLLILLRINNFKGPYGPKFSDIVYSKNKLVLY